MKLFARGPADSRDRELSWLDWSVLRDMSPDGRRILFDETGAAVGTKYGVYMRNIDGSPAVRLGDGVGGTFSPDGTAVVAVRTENPPLQLFLYPTGAGSIRQLTHDAINHGSPVWMPDGRGVVFRGGPLGAPARLYLQPLDGGAPRPITPPGIAGNPFISPDGRWAFIRGPDGIATLYPIKGGAEVKLPEITSATLATGWGADSKSLVYTKRGVNPAPVFRLDLATRKSQPIREVVTPEMIFGVNSMRFSRDGKTYAYCLIVGAADLYLLENVK